MIKQRFSEIVQYQDLRNKDLPESRKSKLSSLLDFQYISSDWTNANTGKEGGVGALLNKERKENQMPELILVGCADHSCNLIVKHFNTSKNEMIKDDQEFKCFKYVKSLYKHLCREKVYFKGFLLNNFDGRKIGLGRMTENRYGSFNLSSCLIFQNIDVFKSYCENHKISKHFDQNDFFSPRCQEELFSMYITAEVFIKPYMKEANNIKSTKAYSEYNLKWIEIMSNSLSKVESFLELWEDDQNSERYMRYSEIFLGNKSNLTQYLQYVLELDASSGKTRATMQQEFFFESMNKMTNDHYIISFCLLVEFACEVIYCLKQRNVDFEKSSDTKIVCATNRSGERVNAQVRKLFLKNPNTNLVVIESSLKVNRLLPSFTLIKSVFAYLHKKKWFQKLFKRSKISIRAKARERISNNKLAKFQYETYNHKKARKEMDFKEIQSQKLAKEVWDKLVLKSPKSTEPSLPINELEIEDSTDHNDDSSFQEENEHLNSFLEMTKKVKKRDLQSCLLFFTGKYHSQKKEELVSIFIGEAKKFLNGEFHFQSNRVVMDDTSRNDIIKSKWYNWIENNSSIHVQHRCSTYLESILSSSENTFLQFYSAKTKWEFVCAMNKKFGLSYRKIFF